MLAKSSQSRRCARLPIGVPCPFADDCDCWTETRTTEWAFWVILIGALLSIGVVMVAAASAADNDPPCLTKEQAKAKYPGQWLYWHTANRCWDNVNTKSRHARSVAAVVKSKPAVWGRENSLKLGKPLPDPNGNIPHHSGKPLITEQHGPSVFYPTLMKGVGTSDNMLQPYSINVWPLIVDFDIDPPLFIPWNQRISTVFDSK